MEKSDLRKRARDLTINIFDVCDTVDSKKGRGVLINQIIRSSTSIGPIFMKPIMVPVGLIS